MRKCILIAEDEPLLRGMLTSFATLHGYDSVAVTNGVDLLLTAAGQHFDAVITDLLMADLDGAAAAGILNLQADPPPVIALTSLATGELQLVQDRFNKVFRKPCEISKVFGYLETVIGR